MRIWVGLESSAFPNSHSFICQMPLKKQPVKQLLVTSQPGTAWESLGWGAFQTGERRVLVLWEGAEERWLLPRPGRSVSLGGMDAGRTLAREAAVWFSSCTCDVNSRSPAGVGGAAVHIPEFRRSTHEFQAPDQCYEEEGGWRCLHKGVDGGAAEVGWALRATSRGESSPGKSSCKWRLGPFGGQDQEWWPCCPMELGSGAGCSEVDSEHLGAVIDRSVITQGSPVTQSVLCRV